MVASWIQWTNRADAVWLLPTFRHAFEKALAPWELRLRMAQALAEAVGGGCRVEPVEADLPVPSYTVRTLEVLAARHPDHELALVVGADVIQQLPHWREIDRLRARFPLIEVGRQGWPPLPNAPSFPDVSSTEIRARVGAGQPYRHLVPASVADIVEGAGLYRA